MGTIINISEDMFNGDVLDLSYGDFSVLYPMFKRQEELQVDYYERAGGKKNIGSENFDTGILMFTLQSINSRMGKRALLKEISSYLKKNGYLHIWDIDKGYGKIFKDDIIINLDSNNEKGRIISIKNFRIANDNSMDSMLKLVQEHFTIVTFQKDRGVYYIKCRKKGR